MYTIKQIANMGLAKIGSSRISRLDPAVTSLEKEVASGYMQWKRSELTKRRWVFATEENYRLTRVQTLEGVERPYVFDLPTDCLRPVREKRTEWRQRRRTIQSAYPELRIMYVANVEEAEFDPLFVDVLACRIAVECVEYVTQSNTKKGDAIELYRDAVADAAKVNAFIIGPEDIQADDSDFSWLGARLGY